MRSTQDQTFEGLPTPPLRRYSMHNHWLPEFLLCQVCKGRSQVDGAVWKGLVSSSSELRLAIANSRAMSAALWTWAVVTR